MRKIVPCIVAALGLVLMSGCATIVGGGPSQAVSFESTPASASYTVRSAEGLQMAAGSTPETVSLPRDNEYQIEITLDGYEPRSTVLTRGINGWIWGNLFVGWIVGFGIDFITGSAYKLEPSFVQVALQEVGNEMFAVIRLLDEDQKLLEERKLLMVRED